MSRAPRPVLDPRDAEAFVREVLRRSPAFAREWEPDEGDPGKALIDAFGHFMDALASRLNEAPDKNQLAFYDALGAALLPASSARAPFVFDALPGLGDSVVPARTRVGAPGPDGASEPVVFETEGTIELAASRLVEVVTVWPGRDAYADHSEVAVRGDAFTLFDPLVEVDHELYLGHTRDLALSGPCTVEVTFDLAEAGSAPLDLVWEYWDGEVWREFKEFAPREKVGPGESVDGTLGLTRSGTVVLATDCSMTELLRVHTAESRWIRARLAQPLAIPADGGLPEVSSITLRTVIDRTLPLGPCMTVPDDAGILADSAYFDDQKLDLTKSVEPMGARPRLGSAFYLASEEIFSKPGAEVTLCFSKVVTPEEKADEEGEKFEVDVENVASYIVQAARDAADTVLELVDAAQELATSQPIDLAALEQDVQDARSALSTEGIWGIEALDQAVNALRVRFNQPPPNGWNVGTETPGGIIWDFISPVPTDESDILDSIFGFRDHNEQRMKDAFVQIRLAAGQARQVLNNLEELTPYGAALAAGATLPSVADPRLVWEYFDGRRWRPLEVEGAPEALNLTGHGPVTFTVPDDVAVAEVAGVEGRWIRARLVEGGYGIVRLVAWNDETTGTTNFFPIVEYRPPVIEKVRFGYLYRSIPALPEHCFARNHLRFTDRGRELRTTGEAFPPIEAVPEPAPSLYLGFEGPLPAGTIGLFFDLEEVVGDDSGPALLWEGWNGSEWTKLQTRDETRHLAVPGIVRVTWPGNPPGAEAEVVRTVGAEVHLGEPREAVRFAPGDLVYVSSGDTGELATVDTTRGRIVVLTAALAEDLGRGRIEVATQPRFGRPLSWIRARLESDGPPRKARVLGIHPNAAWGSQVETYEDEVVGSSSGEPGQVFFLRHTPVLPGAVVEVRELEGPRAEIEGPVLAAELERAGDPDAIREVRDPRTGKVTEVWVRWRERQSLLFSEAGARDYVLERTLGRLAFGGRGRGRIPPTGKDNIRVRRYRAGGGPKGNVAQGMAAQLLSGALVQGVRNARAAEGGAPGEPTYRFLDRGPRVLRHRRLAISRDDYEDLALESSPAVAAARALPATRPDGRPGPGWVTIQIVPRSDEARPLPTYQLRETVRRFVQRRAPASVVQRVAILPPEYFPVGVEAVLHPRDPDLGGALIDEVEERLAAFFHPLTGGPEGRGWPFGRDVHLSDVASAVTEVAGIETIERLILLRDGTPVRSPVAVPEGRIVVAGGMRVTLGTEKEALV